MFEIWRHVSFYFDRLYTKVKNRFDDVQQCLITHDRLENIFHAAYQSISVVFPMHRAYYQLKRLIC